MKQIIIRHSDYSFFCFDFDGVILDTIDLKAEGFAYAFGKVSDTHFSEIIEYQKKHGGQDRLKIFLLVSIDWKESRLLKNWKLSLQD